MKRINFRVGLCIGMLSLHTLFSCTSTRQAMHQRREEMALTEVEPNKQGKSSIQDKDKKVYRLNQRRQATGLTQGNLRRAYNRNPIKYIVGGVLAAAAFFSATAYTVYLAYTSSSPGVIPVNGTNLTTTNPDLYPNMTDWSSMDLMNTTPAYNGSSEYAQRLAYGGPSLMDSNATESSSSSINPISTTERSNIEECDSNLIDTEYVKCLVRNKKDKELLHLLVDHNTDPNIKHQDGENTLMFAAKYGNKNVVQLLLEDGRDPNIKDQFNQTALIFAAKNSREGIVQVLLDYNADPNIKDQFNQTALIFAAEHGNKNITQLLLDHDANPNIQDQYKKTPLMYAAKNGRQDVVEVLIAHNATLNIQDKFNKTALMHAIENGSTNVVKLLKIHGASLDIKDRFGKNASEYIKRYKSMNEDMQEMIDLFEETSTTNQN